ncbi:hypothetical protein KC19_2G152800 [Ceratodon purpureus]|uniref:Secreted protein n=1 Tax=Ceratodon purpureus TaxID=3225 RepID=A0A8T0IY00_CERPU|nr:hypothetical protein KC19_2G152800 [Ceratodon purpureus]
MWVGGSLVAWEWMGIASCGWANCWDRGIYGFKFGVLPRCVVNCRSITCGMWIRRYFPQSEIELGRGTWTGHASRPCAHVERVAGPRSEC